MPPVSFIVSVVGLAAAFLALGTWSGRGVKRSGDYALAGRTASTAGVGGVLLGALVGGASTVGTAEMAYRFGLSAWWFTLGGGLGCLVLGLLLARPVRRTRLETIPQLLTQHYGRPTGLTVLIGSALGSFLSIAAQFLAGAALIRALAPVSPGAAAALVALLILGFMLAGGLKSFAAVGRAKIAMLVMVLVLCVARAVSLGSTPAMLWGGLPHEPFFDLFAQGSRDVSAGLSLIVGVLSTQIYVQAVFAASSESTARRGALLSAALMPPLGLLAIWIGMSVRASGVEIDPAQALPWFVRSHFPPVVAGVLWGVLMVTVVGTAAGVTLGIATNLVRDLYAPARPAADERHLLVVSRLAVALLVALATAVAWRGAETPILRWSYLSMGLRGAGTFFPFLVAGLRPAALPARWALAASAAGTATVLFWPLSGFGGQPLFYGLGVAGALTAAGLLHGARPSLGGASAGPHG